MDFSSVFEGFLQTSMQRLDFIKKELETCPEGRLSQQTVGGKPYFIQITGKGNQLTRRGISKHPDLVVALLRRAVLEREYDCLLSQRQICEASLQKLKTFDLSGEINALRHLYPAVSDSMMDAALRPQYITAWEAAPYAQSSYLPEQKRHVTSRGLRVRSKSELLIAEKLYEHRIPFRYEQELLVPMSGPASSNPSDDRNTMRLIPDFTVLRPDGEVVLWEHQGLMDDALYAERQLRKQALYANAGFVPWKNLIVTYDMPNGHLDLRVVEAEIQNKLL